MKATHLKFSCLSWHVVTFKQEISATISQHKSTNEIIRHGVIYTSWCTDVIKLIKCNSFHNNIKTQQTDVEIHMIDRLLCMFIYLGISIALP